MATAYGRHVVLTFDDVAQAEQFVAAVPVEGAVFFMGTDGHFQNIETDTVRVSGLFGKPNQFCECPWSEGEKHYVRGSKYGLYVHDKCKKPEGGHLQSAPKNLLYDPGMNPKDIVEQENYVSMCAREGKRNWPVPKHMKENSA